MDTVTENILNVTLLEPKQKHPTIFARYDALHEGESLVIHNDHDPKPLYYQLLGERGNVFVWEYLAQGPEWWDVKISKRVIGDSDETLGQLAAKDLRKAAIFKKYGLDFCCGGKKTIKEACAEKGLDVTKIEKEIQETDKVPASHPIPYNEWDLGFLSDYIVNTHHQYVRKTLPDLVGYAAKVKSVHSAHHPELSTINKLVNEIAEELSSHMVKEEVILFPFIKELASKDKKTASVQSKQFGSVSAPINMMEMEHDFVAKNLEEIKKLSNDYSLPADACASYSLLYKMLKEFEEDLQMHIHLENNILFPKAIQLEKDNKNKTYA